MPSVAPSAGMESELRQLCVLETAGHPSKL